MLHIGKTQDADLFSRKRWEQVQILAQHFWNRWMTEYVPTLQERKKWFGSHRNIKSSDLVLVPDNNKHRGEWKLGRIVETDTGQDGLVRTVDVKTKDSILRRGVRELCLLEAA
ncbi:Uncharacterised protein r2_g3396 [Pycnogonum litorale]